jgi:hypothetical protein
LANIENLIIVQPGKQNLLWAFSLFIWFFGFVSCLVHKFEISILKSWWGTLIMSLRFHRFFVLSTIFFYLVFGFWISLSTRWQYSDDLVAQGIGRPIARGSALLFVSDKGLRTWVRPVFLLLRFCQRNEWLKTPY